MESCKALLHCIHPQTLLVHYSADFTVKSLNLLVMQSPIAKSGLPIYPTFVSLMSDNVKLNENLQRTLCDHRELCARIFGVD